MEKTYLPVTLFSYIDMEREVRNKVEKTYKVAGYLNKQCGEINMSILVYKINMSIKSRIYKTCTAETGPDTNFSHLI